MGVLWEGVGNDLDLDAAHPADLAPGLALPSGESRSMLAAQDYTKRRTYVRPVLRCGIMVSTNYVTIETP